MADGSINNAEITTNEPIVIEEQFDSIFSILQNNIRLTDDEKKQKDKILKAKKMLEFFEGNISELEQQTADFNSSQAQLELLSVHVSKARGRGKGRNNRVIGSSVGRQVSEAKTFEQLEETSKKLYILKLILKDEKSLNNVIVDHIKINKENLNHLELQSIPDALASEVIEVKIIKNYFKTGAFTYLKELIEKKRQSTYWSCKMCDSSLGTGDSIECDKCLFWYHWACVNVVEQPEGYWFCPKCTLK